MNPDTQSRLEAAEAALRRAVDALFEQFRHYPGRAGWSDMDASPERDGRPARLAVDKLAPEDFSYFSWHSVTCRRKRGDDAVQYFLPRVLEYHCMPDGTDRLHSDKCWRGEIPLGHSNADTLEMEHMLSLMLVEQWEQWPADDRAAIADWFLALFDLALVLLEIPKLGQRWGRHCIKTEVLDIMEWASGLGIDLEPMLQKWWRNEHPAAGLQIARLVIEHASALASTGLPAGCHGVRVADNHAPDSSAEQLAIWIMRRVLRDRLETAFFSATDTDDQATCSTAVQSWDCVDAAWRMTEPAKGWPPWVERYRVQRALEMVRGKAL